MINWRNYRLLVIILITAFAFAPLGLGGGFLFVPTLYFILGWDLQLSIVCSLILVWFVSIGSRRAHDEGGYTVAGVGRKGRIVAIFGAIIGALAADQIIAEAVKKYYQNSSNYSTDFSDISRYKEINRRETK